MTSQVTDAWCQGGNCYDGAGAVAPACDPASGVNQVCDCTGKPEPVTQEPTVATQEPTVATQKPTKATREPTKATQEPTEATGVFTGPTGGYCFSPRGEGFYSDLSIDIEQCKLNCIKESSCIAIAWSPYDKENEGNCFLQTSCPAGPQNIPYPEGWSYYPLTRGEALAMAVNAPQEAGPQWVVNFFAVIGFSWLVYGAVLHFTAPPKDAGSKLEMEL